MSRNKNNKSKKNIKVNKIDILKMNTPNTEGIQKENDSKIEKVPEKPTITLIKNNNLIKPKLIIPHLVHAKINYLCNKINNIEWSGTLFYTVEGEFNNNLIIKIKDILPQNIGNSVTTEIDSDDINVPCYMVENGLTNCLQGLIHSHHSMTTFFSGTDQATLLEEGKDRIHFVSLIINNDNSYSAAITVKVEVESIISQVINTNYSYNTFNSNTITGNSKVEKEDINKSIQIQYIDLDIEFEDSDKIFSLDNIISELKKAELTKSKVNTYTPGYFNHNYNNYDLPYKTIEDTNSPKITLQPNVNTRQEYLDKFPEQDDSPFPEVSIDTTIEDKIVQKELNNKELGKIVTKEIQEENLDIDAEIKKLSLSEIDFLDKFVDNAYLILLTGTMFPDIYKDIPEKELVSKFTENQLKYYPDETDFSNFINGFIEFIFIDYLINEFSLISNNEDINEDAIAAYVALNIIDKFEPNIAFGHIDIITENLARFV